jgi:hypothetical protein
MNSVITQDGILRLISEDGEDVSLLPSSILLWAPISLLCTGYQEHAGQSDYCMKLNNNRR